MSTANQTSGTTTQLVDASKSYGRTLQRNNRDFGRVFTGMLFALFVATLLMAILAGTGVYRTLHQWGEASNNERLSLSLLVNEVRANDQIDGVARAWVTQDTVRLEIAQPDEATGEVSLSTAEPDPDDVANSLLQGPALVLRETLDSGVYETRIYRYNGTIMEEYALADAAWDPTKATAIVASSTFDFSYQNGLLTLVTDAGEASVALRSAGGER